MAEDIYNTYLNKAYRFMSFESLKETIKNKSLRFTRGDKFNDPLDCSPFIFPFDWKEFETEPKFIDITKNGMFESVLGSSYICCFSKEYDTADSYLMWSRYGKSHTQLCFEIDFSENNFLGGPTQVDYPENLVKSRNELKTEDKNNLGRYIVATKSSIWKYEKEVRLLVDLEYPNTSNHNMQQYIKENYLYVPFDLKYISKIIFGVNSLKKNQDEIINLFKDKDIKPIFQKMRINTITLKLEAKNYDF